LTLARFSEAFLVLRAQTGLSVTWIPLVMVVMALFGALSAYPAGWLSDRMSRTKLLCIGMGYSSWRIWCLLSPVLSSL
jgi:MFS family permease